MRVLRHRVFSRREQIGVGLVVAAPDATAQLVQLSKTEFIGPMHDDGVGRGHVNTGFDNRCAEKQVIALLIKVAHHGFKLTLIHLTVTDHNASLRNELCELLAAVFNRCHVVMQKVHLTAAL